MTENRRLTDARRRLFKDRAVLIQKIIRYDTDLRNVHRIFLYGLAVMLIGLFLLWLAVGDVTLFTVGCTRYVVEPISFGIAGVFFASAGFALSVASVYVRIYYPSKLRELRKSLRDVNDLIRYQRVFPPKFREILGKKHHRHYEDYVKKMKLVKRLESGQRFLASYGLPLCFLITGTIIATQGFLQGYPSEAITVGGLFIIPSTIWIFRGHRKDNRLQR